MGLIIGLSGDISSEDVAHFKAHGADAVLPKPFVVADFDNVVREFFRRRRAQSKGMQGIEG